MYYYGKCCIVFVYIIVIVRIYDFEIKTNVSFVPLTYLNILIRDLFKIMTSKKLVLNRF